MENSNDPVFDIDAEILLAKLHLAAKEQTITDQGMFVVNTGIKNSDDNAKPNNIGNVTFDLNNNTGEYQLGVAKLFNYQLQVDIKKLKIFQDLDKELAKAVEKDKKNNKQKKLTDTTDNNKITESIKVQKKIIKEYLNLVKGFNEKDFKVSESDIEKETVKFDIAKKQFLENVKKENETRNKKLQEDLQKLQSEAFKSIQTYFTVFAGEQNASKISQNQMLTVYGDTDGKIKSSAEFQKNINKYIVDIQSLNKEVKQFDQNIQEKDPNKIIQRHIIFLVGYTVEL